MVDISVRVPAGVTAVLRSITAETPSVTVHTNSGLSSPVTLPYTLPSGGTTLHVGGIGQFRAVVTDSTGAKVLATVDGSATSSTPLVFRMNESAALGAADASGTFASRYLAAGTAAQAAALIGKLRRNVEDAALLVIGDSTGNETTEWVYLAVQALAARFPTHTVNYYLWDAAGGTAYSSAVVVQTGTGPRVLNVYNASVAGATTRYVYGSRWAAAVDAVDPDLVLISTGHNTGDPLTSGGGSSTTEQKLLNSYRMYVLDVCEEIAARRPSAGICIVAQNPTTLSGRENWQAIKASAAQRYAMERGFGFLDVHQAFLDYATANGVTVASLLSDSVHPTTAAQSTIWLPVVDAALQADTLSSGGSRQPSRLLVRATNLLPNGDLSSWGGATPDSWTLTGATLSKETASIFTRGTYSAKFDVPASAGTMSLAQTVTLGSGGLNYLKGQLLTVSALVYAPAGTTITPSLVVQDSGGSSTQCRSDMDVTNGTGRWVWLHATKVVSAASTTVTVQFHARISGSAAGTVYLDSVRAVLGGLPACGF